MNHYFPAPDYPTQFRCVGFIRGKYEPKNKRIHQGVLITDDGCKFPTKLVGKLAKWLAEHSEQINSPQIWVCWPRTLRESPGLWLELKSSCSFEDNAVQAAITAAVDCFSIRGRIVFQNEGKIGIRVQRNRTPPKGQEKDKYWQPFTVVIEGFLPSQATLQFWELDCRRIGERLVLEDARLVEEVSQHNSKSEESVAASSFAPDNKATQPKKSKKQSMAVPAKLEVTLKISELPPAKTVENNWKHFELDCDGRTVSVTVKPKMYKKLEEAQANYPQWVAAIAGKMGETTENGFVLLEPSIQTFEKKAKEPKSAAPESTDEVK